MWARYVPFYLCQRMRSVRQQRFFTLSQHQKKVVSDSFEVHLKVSKQLFLIFHFFHCLKLYLGKLAKLACDQLCQRTLRIQQQIASERCTYGSQLLAHTAHTVALCQRTLRIQQQIASPHCVATQNLAETILY